jgi:hypothetical protein
LSQAEHVRSIGEAITRAVDTFVSGQKASEAELGTQGWRQDFAYNLQDAMEELHRALADAPRRAMDVYYAEGGAVDEQQNEPRPRGARKTVSTGASST